MRKVYESNIRNKDKLVIQNKITEPLGDTTGRKKKETDDKSALFYCDYHHLGVNDVQSWKKNDIPWFPANSI